MIEEPLRSLAESIRDGLIVVDAGSLHWSNAAFGAMVGRVGACLEGLPLAEVLQGLPGPLGPKTPKVFEAHVLHTNGRLVAVRCRRAWASPESAASPWLIEDLDRPRVLEAELLQRSREVASCNREIAELRSKIEMERGAWEESRATLGHEMRTPLTVVGGYARLLLSEEPGPLNSQQRRFLDESQRGCWRLGELLDRLLDSSNKRVGEFALKMGLGKLAPVVEEVAAMFHPLLRERGLALELEIDPIPDLHFDALRIEQVLTNLLGNSIKHAPPGSRIRVGVHTLDLPVSDRAFVEVVVDDEGPGIAAADRERIFEPYVRARNGSPVEGLGLGLSICRRLVEAHGGRIRLEGSGNCGARFAFTLPVSPGQKVPLREGD